MGGAFKDKTRSRTSPSFSDDSCLWTKTIKLTRALNSLIVCFRNSYVNIRWGFFTVKSGLKASVVKRSNRTSKNKMYKYFTTKNTLTYIDVLPQLVKSYNNTYHHSIKMKPTQVTKANKAKVWDALYGSDVQKRVRFRIQVGDHITISKVKRMFVKSYLPNYT